MKIKADYTNAPSWKELTVKSSLPEELKCLDEIAHNMWWVWNYEARDLFRDLDPELYHDVKHNPVMLLERLTFARKEAIVKDKALMKRIKGVYELFRQYMDVKPDSKRPSVAYFCMEYGIHSALKIYSGGLGMLAGDYVKEASDSNVICVPSVSCIVSAISRRACRWTDSRLPTTRPRTSVHCPSSVSLIRTVTRWSLMCLTPTIRFMPMYGV